MQQDQNSDYVNPTDLNLHRFSAPKARSQTQSTFINNPFAISQSSFEGTDGNVNITQWDETAFPWHEFDSSDYNGSLDLRSSYAQDAQALAWDSEVCNKNGILRGGISTWTNDKGPWDPVAPTFANTFSEPEQSSPLNQAYQFTARPQWPTQLVAPQCPPSLTVKSPQIHQSSAKQGENRRDSYFNHGVHVSGRTRGSCEASNTSSQPSSVLCPRFATAQARRHVYTESSTSINSSLTPLPNSADDNSSIDPTYLRGNLARHHGNNSEQSQSQTNRPILDPIEEVETVLPQPWISEQWPTWQGDSNLLSPYASTSRQHDSLNSVGNQFQNTLETYPWMPGLERTTSTQSMDAISQSGTNHNGTTDHIDRLGDPYVTHTEAIQIPASSKRYSPTLSSSFPITQGFYPREIPPSLIDQCGQPSGETRARSNTLPIPIPSSHPMQRNASGSRSSRRSRNGSLSIIREDGKKAIALSTSPNSQKGRRSGPLDPGAREGARQKRVEKTVCIRCRMMKQTCKGGIPCTGCRENIRAKSWGGQQCVLADFTSMIKTRTFNHIFQHRASHLTLDRHRRRTLHYPGMFDVNGLLKRLQLGQDGYNIMVQHWSGSTYTLDLARLSHVLSLSNRLPRSGPCKLDDFCQVKMTAEWLACIKDHCSVDSTADQLSQMITLNNMPSRNTYYLLPPNTIQPARMLNVESGNEREIILFAISLSRIILRALELQLFQALQKELNELPKGSQSDADVALLLRQIGQILISLRWRMSWWTTFGACSEHEAHSGDLFIERATDLAQVLYSYFFLIKKKSWSGANNTPQSVLSNYPDADPIEESLPEDDTVEGFHKWLGQGLGLIRAARVQQHLAGHD